MALFIDTKRCPVFFGRATHESDRASRDLSREIRFAFAATERVELARKRQGVRIFAAGEIPKRWRYLSAPNGVLSFLDRATHESHRASRDLSREIRFAYPPFLAMPAREAS